MTAQARPYVRVAMACALAIFLSWREGGAQTRPKPPAILAPQPPIPLFRAYDFTNSVGVNVHLLHPDTIYGKFELLKQRLLAAHIHHVRDGALDQRGGFSNGDQAALFRELGEAGIRVTFIFKLGLSQQFIEGFPERVSPAFEAYEFVNELNIQNRPQWATELRGWVPSFQRMAKSSPASASYDIIAPSLADLANDPYAALGNVSAFVQFGNIHKYYRNFPPSTTGYGRNGLPPCAAYQYGSLAYALCHARKVSGDKPVICTEAGYGTNPAAGKQVTAEVQARYISRMLMLHLKAGIPRTFIYQLADYGDDSYSSFGLLTDSGAEKPAFRQLRGLMSELDDAASSASAQSLDLSIPERPPGLEAMLFQKNDGSYRLVLWLETPSYDPRADQMRGAPLTVPAHDVIVALPADHVGRAIVTFRDNGEALRRTVPGAPSRVTLPVDDNVTILDIATR
jgi:hypothetical protein